MILPKIDIPVRNKKISRPYPESKEIVMKKSKKNRNPDYGCDNRCVLEYVECVEQEDGASICKTRERNCLEECPL